MTFCEASLTGSSSIMHGKTTKNPCDLELSPMTLKFNRVLEIAKFHQAKCNGS